MKRSVLARVAVGGIALASILAACGSDDNSPGTDVTVDTIAPGGVDTTLATETTLATDTSMTGDTTMTEDSTMTDDSTMTGDSGITDDSMFTEDTSMTPTSGS